MKNLITKQLFKTIMVFLALLLPMASAEAAYPGTISMTSRTGTSISLSWPSLAAAGIPHRTDLSITYKLWRATSQGGNYVQIASTPATSAGDSSLTPGAVYWYFVQASYYNAAGQLSLLTLTADTSFQSTITPPSGGVASTDKSNQIDLSWTAVTGATSYNIYRATSSGGILALQGSATGNTYTDTSVSPGTTYWYTLTTAMNGGESAASNTFSGATTAPLVPPSGLSATQGTLPGRVQLTWNLDPSATSYAIYRDGAAVGYTSENFHGDTIADTLSHAYAVASVASGVESAPSSSITGFAGVTLPLRPSGLAASQGTFPDKVQLTWNLEASATSYAVYRDGALLGFVSTNSYDDALTDASNHLYQVASVALGVEGAKARQVTGFAGMPTGFSGSDTLPPATTGYKIVVKTPL